MALEEAKESRNNMLGFDPENQKYVYKQLNKMDVY